MHNKYPVL